MLRAWSGGASAQSAPAGAIELNEIVVKGQTVGAGVPNNGPGEVKGYVVGNVTAATKTKTPLEKIPASVSVVTRQNLDDRNVQTINDAVAYTPGAEPNIFGYDPRFDAIYIRGFDTTYDGVYRDGLRLANAGGTSAVFHNEPYGLEALTVLRGPAAATYGFGSPGGILDLTSKRPVFSPFGEVQLQFGNFARKQANFDIGGPVAGMNDTLAYRLTGVFRDANAFPTGPDDRIDIAPAFTYRPDNDTSFTFLSGYQKNRLPGNVTFYNTPNLQVTNILSGDPAFNTTPSEQYRIGYAFEHRLSSDLLVRQNFRYSGLHADIRYSQVDAIAPDGLSASRSNGEFDEKLHNVVIDNQVEGHLLIGPTRHTVLSGLDYSHSNFSDRFGFGTVPDLNLVTLNYGQQPIAAPALTSATSQTQDQLGVYLQDQIEWDRATLTLSGRHDNVTTLTGVTPPVSASTATEDAFTGRAGLTYRIVDGIAPYASYATTFIPNLGTDINGNPFAPTRGDQKEVGLKTQVPSTNLHINGALFEIVESNILRTDPTNIAFSSATGQVRSRGYEIEAVDNIAPGTNVTVAYTHLDLRILRGDATTTGNLLSGIPGDTVSAFAKYKVDVPGPLGGLSIGGGVRYAGWSFADDANTAVNRAYTLFDAVIGYDFAHLDPRFAGVRAQLNAYNVFDRYYTTCQAGFCYRGAPAQVIGSLVYRW